MPSTSNSRASKATDAVKRGAEVAANGIYQAKDLLVRNDGRIADGTQAVTATVGAGLDKAGGLLASASQQASHVLHAKANRAAERVREAITASESAGAARKAAGALGWLFWDLPKTFTTAVSVKPCCRLSWRQRQTRALQRLMPAI